MIKVSVIMTVYNGAKYMDRAIKSVVNQTLRDIELIAVNDGSTDQTALILDDWAKRDARIKVLHKTNSGSAHSFNVGLDMACGEYITMLDPDDYLDEMMLDAYYNVAKTMNAEVVRGDFIKFFESGDKEEIYCNCTAFRSLYYKLLNPQKLEEASFQCSHMIWTGIFKREFLNLHHIRCNEGYGASYWDNGFTLKILCNCTRLVLIDQVSCHYQADTLGSATKQYNYLSMEYEFGGTYSYIKTREQFHKFLPVYWYYYYMNNKHILWGISENVRKDYLKHIQAMFLSAKNRGELQKFCFVEHEWENLQTLMNSIEEYEDKLRIAKKNK